MLRMVPLPIAFGDREDLNVDTPQTPYRGAAAAGAVNGPSAQGTAPR